MSNATITPEERAELLSPSGRQQLRILLETYLQHPKLRLLKDGFQCYIDALDAAEARAEKLEKMVGWLAGELSRGCSTSRCVYEGATESCPLECGEHSAGHWTEAARRAVSEVGK